MTAPPVLAMSIGDPAGIGPEITVKALANPQVRAVCRSLVVGDARVVEQAIDMAAIGLKVRTVAGVAELRDDEGTVDVLDLGNVRDLRYGQVDAACGAAAVQAIEASCDLARQGHVDGIVTAPINKEALKLAGSPFPGHTEMLTSAFGVPPTDVFTMFLLDKMRIFFLTRHLPLRDAIAQLTVAQVRDGMVQTMELLRELGIDAPTVALAALNPHAGENGLLGGEENAILEPAVRAARERGVDAVGPIPADAVFHQARQGLYDGVISLYHDQGHIASKTVDFFGTVSLTLGLPVLRASVDHGTAFAIAGEGIADATGQVAAVKTAAEYAPLVLAARQARLAK